MHNNTEIIVAIRCITYNHEPYIRDCLDGFVMQKTNFKFVAIVHDDASTDGTANIIKEYAEKYPDIIKPIFEIENQYSKKDGSLQRIMNDAIEATGAKYVAMCEGDDYWIDPYKLQKQVDFMEANPDYVLTCHGYDVYDMNDKIFSKDYVTIQLNESDLHDGINFTNEENLKIWFTKTLTLLIKRSALFNLPSSNIYKYWRDVHRSYFLLKQGPGYYMPFKGGVYRCHNGGVYGSLTNLEKDITNLKVWNELLRNNQEDSTLRNFYKIKHDEFRNYLRYKVQTRQGKSVLKYIYKLLLLDYQYGGIAECIESSKKLLLTIYYLLCKK